MVTEFISSYIKLLVASPKIVSVKVANSDDDCEEIVIVVASDDIGKVIGKDGKMINAIKTVISGCKAKGGKNYRISVQAACNE